MVIQEQTPPMADVEPRHLFEKDYACFWNEVQQNNEQALYKIYQDIYDNLYHYGVSVVLDKSLVKEAINDVFVSLWQKRGQLETPKNVKGYIFVCFKRRMYKLLTRRHREQEKQDSLLFREPEEKPYEEVLIKLETDIQLQQKMERMLALLTVRQKEFIRMRFYENLSMEEISLKTATSVRTIYNTIHNALVRIREVYSDTAIVSLLLLLLDIENNS